MANENELLFNWSLDKNIEDFKEIARNLLAENQRSRGEAVFYLIERIKIAEAKCKEYEYKMSNASQETQNNKV